MQRCFTRRGWAGAGVEGKAVVRAIPKSRRLLPCFLPRHFPRLLPLSLLPLQEYGLPSSHTLNTLGLNYMFVW